MSPLVTFDINAIILGMVVVVLVIFGLVGLGFIIFTLFRWRGRENRSIDSVLLQIAVPRGNEIKIDAMEQLFAGLFAIKKGGWKQRFSVQPTISFEIVARPEDIKFYVWTPKDLKDLVEKQIHDFYFENKKHCFECNKRTLEEKGIL